MPTTLTAPPLTDAQLAQYRHDGYLVVRDLLTPAEVDAYLGHMSKPRPAAGHLELHSNPADPQSKYLAHHPRITAIARQISQGPLRIVQTMALDKVPSGGIGIALHQDTHYLPSEPNTLMACWLAMTDTDADNGGFCVAP